MTLAEPSATLFETGLPASFEKEDGSGEVVEVRCILENATEERETGDTRRAAAAWHLTCPSSQVAAFLEADTVTIGSSVYQILDRVADDGTACTFLLHLPS
jgi:hypothetical protein